MLCALAFLGLLSACDAPPRMVAATTVSQADHPTRPGASAHIRFLGGDGSALDRAILISGAQGEVDGVQAEYDWIATNRPGWSTTDQALIVQGARQYDILRITKAGQEAAVYFDITEYFGRT